MKQILGLDLGTNSIGWSLIDVEKSENRIVALGSRIIPMSQDVLGKFESGVSVSQTAERTHFRSVRRLRERHLLRRERLHRVLNVMGYLPAHYAEQIDFETRPGKFIEDAEPKIAWRKNEDGSYEFIFKKSFNEMIEDFKQRNSRIVENQNLVPYDWTIYYLRKKALREAISKEELAWIILNFNQKRGYYQLRGDEEEENQNKKIEFHALKVIEVIADEEKNKKGELWYSIKLENGWIYRRTSKVPLNDWLGSVREFIVTTEINSDGTVASDKEGNEKRSFRSPKPDDWTLIKKKTEIEIDSRMVTVGEYIYENILNNPSQKIRGKLVRTIERKYYKIELINILRKQIEFHSELNDDQLFKRCLQCLYPNNQLHRSTFPRTDFIRLFVNDIIFYQRPLKSKKHQITDCSLEFHRYKNEKGEIIKVPLKGIPKSHPLYQEFRIWKFISDLRIIKREELVDGKLQVDVDKTKELLKDEQDMVALFEWLQNRKEVSQESLLKGFLKIKKNKNEDKLPYRWNYVEEKIYPMGETHSLILNTIAKISHDNPVGIGQKEEFELWHILYSINDRTELEKALQSFARRKGYDQEFVEAFKKFPAFKKEYASYSFKAVSRMLSLMRRGHYWNQEAIDLSTKERIDIIIDGETDDSIAERVREKAYMLKEITDFKGLPEWLAKYLIYNRHSEAGNVEKWEKPGDIDFFLRSKFKQQSLRNPIVEQVLYETLKTVKDIWQNYGQISEIHIELGRELKNPADERASITRQITQNENSNLRIKALLMELQNDPAIADVRPYSPSQQEILRIYEDGVINSGIEIPEDISKIAKLAQPDKSQLTRYKLWLEQKYRSPYTGEIIPLGRLFTPDYQIEHIIPQSRYFDDSFSNKVICESEVNSDKDNMLGYEYIRANEGKRIELSRGRVATLFRLTDYENFIKKYYSTNPAKKKKLLLEDIPEAFISRQLNDTRYISKVIRAYLSNIVREKDEIEAISKNVISCSGNVTSRLKKDWGLNDVWNRLVTPRFERLNQLTNSQLFGKMVHKDGKSIFIPEVPINLQKGFEKKRIDHRHHAMDALVIACATRDHINYLSNEHASKNKESTRFDLRRKLRKLEEVEKESLINGERVRKKITVAKEFIKPWDSFTQDAQKALLEITASFKQNTRVLNKTINKYEKIIDGKKEKIRQTKGDNWAVRKPLHKDTVAGLVNLRFTEKMALSRALDNWEMIVDKQIKGKIKQLVHQGFDKKKLQKFFNENGKQWNGADISFLDVYYFSNTKEPLTASRTELDESFGRKKIESVTDSGIRRILLNHLMRYDENSAGTQKEHPELAFSPEGIEEMNRNIVELNKGKYHKPIYKVRVFEPKGNKYPIGWTGNKMKKYVEAAKGTNLYFAVYQKTDGKRSYQTIPLKDVIERIKQGLSPVPELNDNEDKLLFFLSPNDLVYVPSTDEILNDSIDFNNLSKDRIYLFVSSSGIMPDFIPSNSANTIFNLNKKEQEKIGVNYQIQNEFGVGSPKSKNERALTGEMIKEVCIKLKIDRLGRIQLA